MVNSTVGDDLIALQLQEARAGDPDGVGRALESCREYLLLMAARGLDADLVAKGGASDLVQDTLLGAYRDFAAFHGSSRDELLAWLRKILHNNLAVHRRRYRGTRKRRISLEVPLGGSSSGPAWHALRHDSVTPGAAAVRQEQAAALLVALGASPKIIVRSWSGTSTISSHSKRSASAWAARQKPHESCGSAH